MLPLGATPPLPMTLFTMIPITMIPFTMIPLTTPSPLSPPGILL